jgi:hypothetical protein
VSVLTLLLLLWFVWTLMGHYRGARDPDTQRRNPAPPPDDDEMPWLMLRWKLEHPDREVIPPISGTESLSYADIVILSFRGTTTFTMWHLSKVMRWGRGLVRRSR